MDLLLSFITDIEPGRLSESLIFLLILWFKVKPHLKLIEDRMQGIEVGVKNLGYKVELADKRFQDLEYRIENLEKGEIDERAL